MDEVSGTLKNEHRNENENDDDETHTACGWLADTGLRSLCWLGERILIYILSLCWQWSKYALLTRIAPHLALDFVDLFFDSSFILC